MPEEEPIQGNRWLNEAVKLLSSIGWTHRGDTRIDIPCTMHSNRKKPHGVDGYFTYFDPYQDKEIGIMIEAKHYGWKSINKAFLQESVDDLIDKLECVPHSDEFIQNLNPTKAKTDAGILLIWSKGAFDEGAFKEYVKGLDMSKRRNTMRVYVLGNSDILRLFSVSSIISDLTRGTGQGGSFNIYYPSYQETDSFRGKNLITIEYVKSKFIFAKMIRMQEDSNHNRRPINVTVVFYFDKMRFENLDYMYLALRRFQLTDDEIIVYSLGDPESGRAQIREFKRTYGYENNEQKKMEFRSIPELKNISWSEP